MSDQDAAFAAARSRLIAREALGASVRRIRWSGGETDVIEMGSGPPLLLIHGGANSSCDWVPILPDLADNYRVLAVDQPGHGDASPFDYSGVNLNEHAVRFVGETLDALGLARAPIMANSIGGFVAARFAQHEPDRVERLVLAGCPAGLKRTAPAMFRMMALPLVPRLAFANPNPKGSRSFMRSGLGVAQPELLSDELVDCDVENTRRNRSSFLSLLKRVMDLVGVRREWLLGTGWSEMPEGTTILWGENEPWGTPAWGTGELARLGADIRVIPIPNAGHLPWWDQPELVVKQAKQSLNH